MAAIHYDSYSLAFNKWLDFSSGFREEFAESQEMSYVIRVVLGFLNNKLNYPIEDPDHPFRRYADIDKTISENYGILASDVIAAIQEVHLRSYVYAFFHTGGANYADMTELMAEYFLFADHAEDPDYAEDGSDDGSEDEEEEGDDSEDAETEVDNAVMIPPEHDSTDPNASY